MAPNVINTLFSMYLRHTGLGFSSISPALEGETEMHNGVFVR